MKGTKPLVSNALSTLLKNIGRTGDPLGFKGVYWTDWAKDLGIPDRGRTVLFTARMYQMLPYIRETTELMRLARPLLSLKGAGMLMDLGNRLAGERVVRFRAGSGGGMGEKGTRALQGIAAALRAAGQAPAYLYHREPYSGILLSDLGLDEYVKGHVDRVYRLFKAGGVEEIICVDPHTTFMMREVFPRYLEDYDLRVSHYLEVLARNSGDLQTYQPHRLPGEFVIHDSCVMTRDLGMVEEVRRVCAILGIKIVDPENSRTDTACCGGPVEYAFSGLSRRISSIRGSELARFRHDVLVTCPICLLNLSRQEETHGIRVWDMGEILHELLTNQRGRGGSEEKGIRCSSDRTG